MGSGRDMDILKNILDYNSGRDPDRLAIKYRLMRENSFAFLRATCHLFYQRLPPHPIFDNSPATWVCGDLHLENFGGYKADDGRIYFDINDFEESTLGPCTLDLVRLLASVLVAAPRVPIDAEAAALLCTRFLRAYTQALAEGTARSVEQETAGGIVENLLGNLAQRKRADFLNKRSEVHDGKRSFKLDGKQALPVSPGQRAQMTLFMDRFAGEQTMPARFTLLDVARRVSGNSSLGLERYVLLVEGDGSPDGNYLFDLKQAIASALPAALKLQRQNWNSEAERIVAIERRMQPGTPAFLQAIMIENRPYVLRELQPSADKVAIDGWDRKVSKLDKLLETMGQVLAWDQLRGSGSEPAATREQLRGFALDQSWRGPLQECALVCARQVERDSGVYAKAYDAGVFKPR